MRDLQRWRSRTFTGGRHRVLDVHVHCRSVPLVSPRFCSPIASWIRSDSAPCCGCSNGGSISRLTSITLWRSIDSGGATYEHCGRNWIPTRAISKLLQPMSRYNSRFSLPFAQSDECARIPSAPCDSRLRERQDGDEVAFASNPARMELVDRISTSPRMD